ncbi:uncharacterized protein LTR77_005603 [Saxophila tyrrhenica]|uniref:Peptidase S53 domain-containing protein n=1 Tax=Saxophila tyrrhenica TaxID=1690608 RepID=A0AAV9PB71_9PEZI|nr:hypothetical protein LTR77_005603 [Saxophila tyrrhenica]
MLFSFVTLLPLLVLEATAGPVRKAAFREHGWERKFIAPRDGRMKLHIALRQSDGGAEVERQLLSVSNPGSASFRQHLGAEQAASISTPAHGSVHAVEFWLWKYGLLNDASLFGGIYEIDTTIRSAERLLNTTYFAWSDGEREVIRTELFYLPDSVDGYIDFVTPTTSFPKRRAMKTSLRRPAGDAVAQRAAQAVVLNEQAECAINSFATPTCIRQAYKIDYQAQPNRTTFAVYGTEAASFNPVDLQTYLQRYNSPAAEANAQYGVVGNEEYSSFTAKFETALDTQTLLGLAWPARGILYNNGGVFGPSPGTVYDPFVQFLQELITNKTVPSVVSFSESLPENQLDPVYARRLCNMMAQVGARGVSLLFSSGNNGPNGDQPTGTHKEIFEPEFPASCPWVTAVGGTTNLKGETAATKETIGVIGRLGYTASGGGFSNLFSAPDYQKSVVDAYVANHVPASYASVSGFNAQGRGIPDVSAFFTNFPTVVDYITFPVARTSAATPVWAAVVTLLNDYEAGKGRSPLGFINPWLYSLDSGLKDITTGGNNAGSCDLLGGCTLPETLRYEVTEGWDLVTGLGSPMFSELTRALDAIAERKK